MSRTRAEHLTWCKRRALAYLPGDPQQAFTSMASDLRKHEETLDHPAIELGFAMLMTNTLSGMRKFIEGFN